MSQFIPRHSEYEVVVRSTFVRTPFMALLGAALTRVEPGVVEIEAALTPQLGQQKGAAHAGVIASLADSAAGLAAQTLMEAGRDVVSVEFKLNLLAPAVGARLLARGRVVRAGKTLSVCAADVYADDALVATMLGTMMAVASS